MIGLNAPLNRIRTLLIFFMLGLTLSGLSAIPVQWELGLIKRLFEASSWVGNFLPAFLAWMNHIYQGVQDGYGHYPFLAYGTDWLAFGHVMIAIAFIGPLRDPLKNIWVVEFGMIACLLVIPWAILFSILRNIPLFRTLIDMSFGVFGIIPLWLVRHDILKLEEELY